MSVVFATITDEFVILCADKQATNPRTGETQIDAVTKVEKWASSIGIGRCGNLFLSDVMLSAVRKYVKENGVNNFTLEEIAEFFSQSYYIAKEEYSEISSGTACKFIVAGKLSNGKLGAIQVIIINDNVEIETVEGSKIPVTLIYEPDDLSSDECNRLFRKAIAYTKKNNKYHKDPLEAVHRKAVRYVSESSKSVGHKSDYIVITL